MPLTLAGMSGSKEAAYMKYLAYYCHPEMLGAIVSGYRGSNGFHQVC